MPHPKDRASKRSLPVAVALRSRGQRRLIPSAPCVLVPVLVSVSLLSACRPDPTPAASPSGAPVTASQRSTPASTPDPGPSASAPASPAPAAPSSSAAATASAAPAPTFPRKPAPIAGLGGQTVWAVYLATFPDGNDEWRRTRATWEATRLPIGAGDLHCDHGATEAGIAGEYYVAVYFATEVNAKAFAAGTTPRPVGIAKVKLGCAD